MVYCYPSRAFETNDIEKEAADGRLRTGGCGREVAKCERKGKIYLLNFETSLV
jgi:hypothetical protein